MLISSTTKSEIIKNVISSYDLIIKCDIRIITRSVGADSNKSSGDFNIYTSSRCQKSSDIHNYEVEFLKKLTDSLIYKNNLQNLF